MVELENDFEVYYMSNIVGILKEAGTACPLLAPGFWSMLLIFLVFCVVFFVLFVFDLYRVFPVSLVCPFLIGPSIFSNVYLQPI